jgi:hypothetical protein
MKKWPVLSTLLIVSIAYLGCAAAPKVPFSVEKRLKVKTVAVVELPEPEKYFLDPGQLPGGPAFYMFGALGGLVLGGIEGARAESATNEFTQAIAPHSPKVSNAWNESIIQLLKERGYQVTAVPSLPKSKEADHVDYSPIRGKYDAVFVSTMSAGYAVEPKVEPRVLIDVKLLSSECSDTLFYDQYVYGTRQFGQMTFIERDGQYTYPDRGALISDPKRASSALRTGVLEISKRVASSF